MSDLIAPAAHERATQKTQGSTHEKSCGMSEQNWRIIALLAGPAGNYPNARA